ncbi:hypothetical protein LPJ69_005589, partial [Coemansia sp. RSA 1752]
FLCTCKKTRCFCTSRRAISVQCRCAFCTGTFRANRSRRASTRVLKTRKLHSKCTKATCSVWPKESLSKLCWTIFTLWAAACRGNCLTKKS